MSASNDSFCAQRIVLETELERLQHDEEVRGELLNGVQKDLKIAEEQLVSRDTRVTEVERDNDSLRLKICQLRDEQSQQDPRSADTSTCHDQELLWKEVQILRERCGSLSRQKSDCAACVR